MLPLSTTACRRPTFGFSAAFLLASLSLSTVSAQAQRYASPPAPPQAAAESREKILLPLKMLSAESLHARLEKILRRRLATSQDPSGKWLGFNIDQVEGQPVTIWANNEEKQVQLSGPVKLVESWKGVIMLLDTPTNGASITQMVATKPSSKAKIRQAVNAIEAAGSVAQNETEQEPGNPTLAAPNNTQNDAESDSVGVSLLGPMQIETVEGTDILLLRGNQRDVDRVLEVIENIERMSDIGDPGIEVVALEHVDSKALAILLEQIFTDNTQKYGYGSVGVYPLSRPNSILLIALPISMQRAKETIAKLDRPGEEEAQFESIQLKHGKASDILQIVESLFPATEAQDGTTLLEPKAQVIADDRTNTLIVRASPRDLKEIRALVERIDQLGSKATNDLRIFKLKSSVAEDLENVLREAFTGDPGNNDANNKLAQLLRLVTIDAEGKRILEQGVLSQSRITSSASANALIVEAPAESMPLLESLIEQLDQSPDAAIEMKIFPLENGDATALVDTLSELFSTGEGGQGNNDQGADITRLRVEVDQRTNSILAAGSREDLITVEAILRTLDSAEGRERENRVYRLKHKFAFDLAPALNQLLQAEREVLRTAPGTVSPFEQLEREVLVVNEDSSNSLLVSATPSYFERIDRLINELDVQEEMVMIQVLIAEIELGDIDEFGVELGLQDSVLFDRSLLGELLTTTNTTITNDVAGGSTNFEQEIIQSATNTPGFSFGDPAAPLGNAGSTSSLATAGSVASQALSSFGVNRVSSNAGFGGLVLSASSNSVSMLLRALQESRRMEVLSRPQIMALNNQQGSAFVGQVVPFILSSTPDLNTGQPINTVTQLNVGLELIVIPRISPNGLVVMDITATNNRLRPLSEGVPVAIAPNGVPILQPIQDSIQARTVVSAMSGQTVVLSGLITKEDNALHRRVPILADIPLLGSLFRFDSVSTRRRELLIIMTPHVVKNRFDTEMLKQVESARMNWCLSDVVALHGPAGLRSQSDRAGVAEAETVYPEQIPAEQYQPPQQSAPQPQYAPAAQQYTPSAPMGLEQLPTSPNSLPVPR